MSRLLGAHTVDKGGIHMAALRAGRSGMQALQIFTAIPKYYGDKTSIRPERVQRFREALRRAGIDPANVLVHSAYVLNTATADEEKWARAAAGLRCSARLRVDGGERETVGARERPARRAAVISIFASERGAARPRCGAGSAPRQSTAVR